MNTYRKIPFLEVKLGLHLHVLIHIFLFHCDNSIHQCIDHEGIRRGEICDLKDLEEAGGIKPMQENIGKRDEGYIDG